MEKKRFFYLKNTLILSVLLFLFISIPPVFASELNQNLTYDGNGNLITGDGKYRVYNEFNQLIRVYDGSDSSGDILESYLYHPIENRILIKYWYDGVNIEGAVAYINENLEEEYYLGWGDNNHLSNFTYYIYDENGLAGEIVKNRTYSENITDHQYYPDALVSVKNLSYHNDYSGTVSLITNSSGGVVEQTFYEPFGGILEGGNESRYSYEGKEFSSATEDFDFHFRKYDPSLMIFTQPDSVIADVYDPQSLNRYAFERNNPYKYVDEDGKIPQKPLANLQNAWRFGNGNEFSKLGQDLTNTLNSKEFAPYRFAWSLTLEPFYKGIKSYSEISTRLSYGKDYPFASQDIVESTNELSSSIIDVGLNIASFLGVGGAAITALSTADTAFSAYQTGFISYIFDNVNGAFSSIQYDIVKSSTFKSTSSSIIQYSNKHDSSNKKLSTNTSIEKVANKVTTSIGNFIRRLFKIK